MSAVSRRGWRNGHEFGDRVDDVSLAIADLLFKLNDRAGDVVVLVACGKSAGVVGAVEAAHRVVAFDGGLLDVGIAFVLRNEGQFGDLSRNGGRCIGCPLSLLPTDLKMPRDRQYAIDCYACSSKFLELREVWLHGSATRMLEMKSEKEIETRNRFR